MSRPALRDVVEDHRANAAVGWVLVTFLCLTALTEFSEGDLVWAGFVFVVAALAVVPAAALRDPRAMLPSEVLALAALPIVSRAFIAGDAVRSTPLPLSARVTTYLAVAAVALIVAVELDVFTEVRMNHSFAVFFVGIATTAAAGIWAVAQWLADLYLGTAFLLDGRPEHEIETALMWDFVAATSAGVLAGIIFVFYFRRRLRVSGRAVANRGEEA
jgi:hypothetical protein